MVHWHIEMVGLKQTMHAHTIACTFSSEPTCLVSCAAALQANSTPLPKQRSWRTRGCWESNSVCFRSGMSAKHTVLMLHHFVYTLLSAKTNSPKSCSCSPLWKVTCIIMFCSSHTFVHSMRRHQATSTLLYWNFLVAASWIISDAHTFVGMCTLNT